MCTGVSPADGGFLNTVARDEKTLTGKPEWPTVGKVVRDKTWLAMCVACIISLSVVYHQAFYFWWEWWWREESYYSHGIVIPFLSLFLIWCGRKRIGEIPANPSAWGFALLVPAMLLQIVSYRSSVESVAGLTFPVMILGAVILLLGIRAAKAMLFPIAFLYFMCVPPTNYLALISFKIQMISTTLATLGLKAIGIMASQNGTQISLPSGVEMNVAAPCSGFRMLIALLAFVIFFAYIRKGPMWGRLAMVALVIPIGLLANSVRVLLIAIVGEFYGESSMLSFHDYSGYIVLILSFIGIALVARMVKCREFEPEIEAGFDQFAEYLNKALSFFGGKAKAK